MDNPVAHVRKTADGYFELHDLDEHLREVGKLAREFAEVFHAGDWGELAGLWHDLGKYRARFQRYIGAVSGFDPDAHIEGKSGKAPHSTAGALLACDKFKEAGRILAYLIAGHHAGLSDWHDGLEARLVKEESRQELEESLAESPPGDILAAGDSFVPDLRSIPGRPAPGEANPLGFALWVRMLFSCLVDADFLDTERFMDGDRHEQRAGYPEIAELLACFDRHMSVMSAKLAKQGQLSAVNQLRAGILQQCRSKAAEPPGLFSLTVPTGGGKTLSSLAFALEHAACHGLRRVVYVIPYTSIIEQTANVFRSVFDALEVDPVIEHHSNAEMDDSQESLRSRLACENWDAPIVVTTSVQFFESLFAARTSRCRKLHNLVNSVVVLDEAQLLPPEFLQPILDVLNLLARHYGVSVVLSTATQPALATREYFDPKRNLRGLENVRELMAGGPWIKEPDELYRALKRVRVELPADFRTPVSWEALAAELQEHDSVLCIVNRRQDARELFKRMPEGTLHLSALMCGAHRSEVIRRIKERLKKGIPTRVISTQLVEAGVDLDFPVVYRALAGLDSIAQAAGRCNREGLADSGLVVVFIPPTPSPPGHLKTAEDASRRVLHCSTGELLDRGLFARYFEYFYHDSELDRHGISKLLEVSPKTLAVNFKTAAAKFRLISEEDMAPIIVKYRKPDDRDRIDILLGKLRKDGPERWLMRKFQRYTVNVRHRDIQRWAQRGDVQVLLPGLFVQVSDVGYCDDLGLVLGDDENMASQILIA